MVYLLDRFVNIILNLAGFAGLEDPHQVLIAVVLASGAVLWNQTLVPRWALTTFFALMGLATAVAVLAIAAGVQPTCIYAYNDTKPIFKDSHERKLSWQEIRSLDCPTLWVARNELFYRSQYCFFTPIGFSYFGNDATCDPAVEKPGTEIGDENARIIQRMESRKACPAPISNCRQLGKVTSSRLELKRTTTKN